VSGECGGRTAIVGVSAIAAQLAATAVIGLVSALLALGALLIAAIGAGFVDGTVGNVGAEGAGRVVIAVTSIVRRHRAVIRACAIRVTAAGPAHASFCGVVVCTELTAVAAVVSNRAVVV